MFRILKTLTVIPKGSAPRKTSSCCAHAHAAPRAPTLAASHLYFFLSASTVSRSFRQSRIPNFRLAWVNDLCDRVFINNALRSKPDPSRVARFDCAGSLDCMNSEQCSSLLPVSAICTESAVGFVFMGLAHFSLDINLLIIDSPLIEPNFGLTLLGKGLRGIGLTTAGKNTCRSWSLPPKLPALHCSLRQLELVAQAVSGEIVRPRVGILFSSSSSASQAAPVHGTIPGGIRTSESSAMSEVSAAIGGGRSDRLVVSTSQDLLIGVGQSISELHSSCASGSILSGAVQCFLLLIWDASSSLESSDGSHADLPVKPVCGYVALCCTGGRPAESSNASVVTGLTRSKTASESVHSSACPEFLRALRRKTGACAITHREHVNAAHVHRFNVPYKRISHMPIGAPATR